MALSWLINYPEALDPFEDKGPPVPKLIVVILKAADSSHFYHNGETCL